MSVSNLFYPNNDTLYCGILNAGALNVGTETITNLTVTNLKTLNNTLLSQSATQTNPTVFIGNPALSTLQIGQATVSGAFFSDSAPGDMCISNTAADNILIGVSGANPQLLLNSGNCNVLGTLMITENAVVGNSNPTPQLTFGQSSYPIVGTSTAGAAFFTNELANDLVLVNTSGTNQVIIGVGSGTASQIAVQASDVMFNVGLYLPTPGGNPGLLNDYEIYTDLANSYSGIWTASLSITLEFTRIGNQVTVAQLSDVLANATTASYITWSGTIPARLVPVQAAIRIPLMVKDNQSNTAPTPAESGYAVITNTGTITIFNSTTVTNVFSGLSTTGTSGVYSWAGTYSLT
jgi:hypothetical protein